MTYKHSGKKKQKEYYHLTCKNPNCKNHGLHYNSNKIEQKLSRILDELVRQRTQQLNNKLNENKKLYNKLIETERYKNNYFINLSHELRTPLNVILSVEQLISSLNKDFL